MLFLSPLSPLQLAGIVNGTWKHLPSHFGCQTRPESQSCSVLSDSLQPQGIYSPRSLQARLLEWVAVPFSRGSSQPRDWTQVSCITGRFFISWVTREPKNIVMGSLSLLQQIFLTQEWNRWPGIIVGRFFTSWATREAWDLVEPNKGQLRFRPVLIGELRIQSQFSVCFLTSFSIN